MLIGRDKIQRDVVLILQHYNSKRKIKDKIISKFEERGFLYGEVNAIFSGTTPLIQVSDELFYLLIVILYKTIDEENLRVLINPDKVLTSIEKDIADNLMVDRSKENIYPIVIENVNMDAEGDYSTIFTLETLSEFFDKRIIKYNPQTQRPLISKFYGGKEIKEIFINDTNRREIEKNIIEDKQVPNVITFNLLENGNESFDYDSNKRTLTLYSGEFDCTDGWHRTVAGRNAFRAKPHSKFYYKVRITHWDIDKTKAFIHQESLGSKLDPLAKKSYDVYNPVNQVIAKLNENPKSNLGGKITTNKSDIYSNNALVMFDVLFDSITYTFDVKDNRDVVNVSNYLKDGINLISDNNVGIIDKQQSDQLWVAYFVSLAKCYGETNWKTKLMEIVDSIDTNTVELIPYKTINKTFVNKVKGYIDTLKFEGSDNNV